MQAICVKGLSKIYTGGFEALKNIDLTIQEGEIFGLLGPNGAGKSTLISILSGVTRKTNGEIKIFDYSIPEDHLKTKRILGVVPQELSFDGFFTVEQLLQFQSGYFGLKNNQSYIDEILQKLNLSDKRHTNSRMLSGGMKRRLLVAKAMIHRPRILILDEPTAGVDIQLVVSLWNMVRELRAAGTTILLTTHNLAEAEAICDRICIIDKGQILALGQTKELLSMLGKSRQAEIHLSSGDLILESFLVHQKGEGMFQVEIPEGELGRFIQSMQGYTERLLDLKFKETRLEDVFLKLVGQS